MKLTEEQINFIEDYLIKNKVKYWDVRIELLDHVASDVEERMQNGLGFEDALKEVHLSFGNKLQTEKLSEDQQRWVTYESLYADHSGYQKLIMQKQRQLNRAFRSTLWKELKGLFAKPMFLLVYATIMVSFYLAIRTGVDEQVLKKVILLAFLLVVVLKLGWLMKTFLIDRRRSLSLEILNVLPLLFATIPNLLANLELGHIRVYFALAFFAIPFITASILATRKQLLHYQKSYQKW